MAVELSDTELVAAVAGGDRDALRALYDRHSGWLIARLRSRCPDNGTVDEVLQDTFLATWRSAATFRGDGEVGAWLWGIAVRRLIDARRREARVPLPVLDDHEPVPQSWASAEDEALSGLEHGPLVRVLGRLSDDLRAAVQACVIDGLSVREAAELLGVPEGTIKTRVHRARIQMRRHLP